MNMTPHPEYVCSTAEWITPPGPRLDVVLSWRESSCSSPPSNSSPRRRGDCEHDMYALHTHESHTILFNHCANMSAALTLQEVTAHNIVHRHFIVRLPLHSMFDVQRALWAAWTLRGVSLYSRTRKPGTVLILPRRSFLCEFSPYHNDPCSPSSSQETVPT